jgi:hypothetical protein
MKVFLVSLVAAGALMMALAGSAFGGTNGHFPEGVSNAGTENACAVLAGTPAVETGSTTGLGNKEALYFDACLGGP